jgi:hypothetical protein
MSITDYNSLIQQLERYSKRTDVGNELATFVRLTEIRIDSVLQMRKNEVRATLPLNTDDRFCRLPDGFLEMRSLRLITDNKFYDLLFRTPKQLSEVLKTRATMPTFYTINSKVELDAIPDKSYTLEMEYYKILDALTETNTTNDVITKYPNLYLYGGLTELFLWARDPDEAERYLAHFEAALINAKHEQNRGRFGPAPSMRFNGPTP